MLWASVASLVLEYQPKDLTHKEENGTRMQTKQDGGHPIECYVLTPARC